MRWLKTLLALLVISILSTGILSCKGSNKTMCQRDGTYKHYQKKGGKSKYSSIYRSKSSPVRKDYVIKNKKKR